MGTESGCIGERPQVAGCGQVASLRPVVLELRMPFSPEAGGAGALGILDPRTVDGHAYVGALSREVLASAPDYADCQVGAVALTGGMAAHVADDALGALLRDVRQRYAMAPDVEVSLRARPGMVSAASVDMMRIGHVNRIVMDYATSALGEWRALGRMLDPGAMDVTRTVLGPRGAGGLGVHMGGRDIDLAFELVVGIPGQTSATAHASVEAALAYGATEIRLLPYGMACTGRRDPMARPAELVAHELSSGLRASCVEGPSSGAVPSAPSPVGAARDALLAAGFMEYLPSRWALSGHESHHELLAAGGVADLLGFGLAAHTRFDGVEARNTSDLATYLRFSDDPEKCVAEVHPAE